MSKANYQTSFYKLSGNLIALYYLLLAGQNIINKNHICIHYLLLQIYPRIIYHEIIQMIIKLLHYQELLYMKLQSIVWI